MKLLKSIVLRAISTGFSLPQPPLDRISELVLLRRLLAQLKIDCVLDVGANEGQFAHELRQIGYDGAIISFEPVQKTFAALRARFGEDARWRGMQLALGSQPGLAVINVHDASQMNSLLPSRAGDERHGKEQIQVDTLDRILPAVVSEIGASRVFLKMDTQGYDLQVFRGASACLPLIHGIQSELSVRPLYEGMPHYLESLQVYEAAGFNLYNLSVVNRVAHGGLLEMNCFLDRRQ